MFIIRSAELNDLEPLLNLSKLMTFINLPQDEVLIRNKINTSIKSFKKPSANLWENYYLFILEDKLKSQVIGCSMIHAQHGTSEEPHFFLQVSHVQEFSDTIKTGFIHGT